MRDRFALIFILTRGIARRQSFVPLCIDSYTYQLAFVPGGPFDGGGWGGKSMRCWLIGEPRWCFNRLGSWRTGKRAPFHGHTCVSSRTHLRGNLRGFLHRETGTVDTMNGERWVGFFRDFYRGFLLGCPSSFLVGFEMLREIWWKMYIYIYIYVWWISIVEIIKHTIISDFSNI